MRQRILAGIILSLTAVTSDAALLGRAPITPGGTDYQAYYDTALNTTWLANANLALTNSFGVSGICTSEPQCITDLCTPDPECTGEPGIMTWYVAQEWIAAMNTANYLGVSNWRLPNMDVNGDQVILQSQSCATPERFFRDNQLNYMKCWNGVHGSLLSAPFYNIGRSDYLFGLVPSEYASSTVVPATDRVWYFPFGGPAVSGTTRAPKSEFMYVWPVSPGDLLAVPTPAALWLLGSALGVLGAMRRRAAR